MVIAGGGGVRRRHASGAASVVPHHHHEPLPEDTRSTIIDRGHLRAGLLREVGAVPADPVPAGVGLASEPLAAVLRLVLSVFVCGNSTMMLLVSAQRVAGVLHELVADLVGALLAAVQRHMHLGTGCHWRSWPAHDPAGGRHALGLVVNSVWLNSM